MSMQQSRGSWIVDRGVEERCTLLENRILLLNRHNINPLSYYIVLRVEPKVSILFQGGLNGF